MNKFCSWPSGTCQNYIEKKAKPDPYGRVWMHCESGLTNTKASMGRFMVFCLSNNVELGGVYAFNPKYKGSLACAAVLIKPELIEAFEQETKGKLRLPPKIRLN